MLKYVYNGFLLCHLLGGCVFWVKNVGSLKKWSERCGGTLVAKSVNGSDGHVESIESA